jgi:DNA-binding transcriptional MerR regulator
MATAQATRGGRPLRIGAVCALLREEFPDISISKIRYLEDQGLLNPTRTQGGYRLYATEDVERLRTVLRLQRDEFLPLRVIREELATTGRSRRDARKRAPASGFRAQLEGEPVSFEELSERSGADPALVRELEQYKLLRPAADGAFHETDVAVVEIAARLLRYGIEPRGLGQFRRAADNQAYLVAQRVTEDLRATRPDRRERGLEDLEKLSSDAVELARLLFWQALRLEIAG